MSTGSGGKPNKGSQPGRPAADTPQRLVVRSLDGSNESMSGDTAIAVAVKNAGTADTATTGETEAGDVGDSGETRRSGAPVDLIGTTLSGKYLVSRQVGQGGMGAVYESTHTGIGKRVAIKVLLEKYAQREAIVKRLRQEATLASSVGNEHIIDIIDIDTTPDGRTFVVMEFLEGESLAECLTREHTLPEKRILAICSQVASALAAAHKKEVVHRDIKPENLFLLRRKDADFVKVVDFGISKSLRASTEEEEAATRLTQTGMVLGTPLYMSPEQARGDDQLDHRVDVYALGVIMYEAATGRVPFIGSNYLSVISQVLNEEPPSLREQRPEISEEYEAVVLRAMAKDVKERYASASAMLKDINALLEDPTHSTERAKITGPRKRIAGKPASRYVVWIAAIAVVIAAVVFSVTQMLGGSSKRDGGAGSGSAIVVTAPPIDAAIAVVVPDVAAEPEVEFVIVEIHSTPSGATVLVDGLDKGVTPLKYKAFKRAKEIEVWLQLDGYDAQEFSFNPMDYAEGGVLKAPALKKPTKGKPPVRPTHKPPPRPDQPDGTPPPDKTGGDFGGNPFGKGGTVSPKK